MSSEIAYFSVDSEITYPEYTALLYEHAVLELENQAEHLNEGGVVEAVEALKEKSKSLLVPSSSSSTSPSSSSSSSSFVSVSAPEPDVAYFFASRAVRLASAWYKTSKANADAASKARARQMFSSALTYCEKLKQSALLQNLFDKLMASVRSSLPERERLKKLQMENVEVDSNAIADRNAKELENALAKGSGGGGQIFFGTVAAAEALDNNEAIPAAAGGDHLQQLQQDRFAGEVDVDGGGRDLQELREARRQLILKQEREALLLLQQQQQQQQFGFDFNSLVVGDAGSVVPFSTVPPPPPPPTIPPPPSSILPNINAVDTGKKAISGSDAILNLQHQFSDAISIATTTNPSPQTPLPQLPLPPTIRTTPEVFLPTAKATTTTVQPSAALHQVPASVTTPTSSSSTTTATSTTIATTNAMNFGGISLIGTAPTTTTTATSTAALDQAKEFLKSNPAPSPLAFVASSSPTTTTTTTTTTATTLPTNTPTTSPQQPPYRSPQQLQVQQQLPSRIITSVPPPPSSQPQPQQQLLLPPKRMFQFGRNAIWHYPRNMPTSGSRTLLRRGLVNLGNSCYLNSVVQCLCCTPLREAVGRESGSRLACALNFVFKALRVSSDSVAARTPVGPSAVKSAVASRRPQFGTMQQQDASEFFVEALDQLCSETHSRCGPKPSTRRDIDTRRANDAAIAQEFLERFRCINNSAVGCLFAFQTRQMNMCNRCGENAKNFDVMMTLDLPIPLGAPPGTVATLHDCLSLYTKPDVTPEGRDAFYKCEGCRAVRGSTHQTSIYSVPKILVITLKRFRQVETGNFSDKVNVPVVYPVDLDLAPFMLAENRAKCSTATKFRLVGHVSHQGNTHGGHYTASTCDYSTDRQWWFSSDERLNEVGGNQADFAFAYMLFYVRND